MKFNSVIIGSDAYPKLTGQTPTQSSSTTTNNGLDITTGSGYIRLGPQNTSYCHITTDRSNFYFNTKMIVNSGIFSSYDEDLVLRRADNSSHQITVTDAKVTTPLDIELAGGNLTRTAHQTGHLEGGHNNIGSTATKTSPIYTIGSNYNPTESALSNMYGIGFSHGSDASFISMGGASGWGLYVAADGDARIFLDATSGHISTTGEHYAGNGAAGNPSFSFISDTDSGMYRSTTNEVGFATGGTQRLNLSSRGVDVLNGDLELDGGAFVRKRQYSGTGNFNTSGSWFTLAMITEHNTPAYFALKLAAHSTITFVATTGYHGSNVAHINVLSTTWTPNGGYPHPYQIRVLKDSSNNYRLQLKMQWSSLAGFTMDVRVWGAGHAKDVPSLQTSFTEDSTTGTEITAVTISRTGSSNSGSHSTRDGSAGTPAYSFFNDTNTGMYRAGTDQVAFSAGGTQHLNVTNGSVDVGTTGGNTRLVIYKADNNTSDHLMFYLGSTRIGEIGCEDTSWLRINQETSKNIYTPRMFRADGGFQTGDGSVGSPGLAFQADTNTGIYRVGSDQLGITAGGSRKFYTSTTNAYFQNLTGGVHMKRLTLGTSSEDAGELFVNDTSTTAYTLGLLGTGTRGYTFRGSSSSGNYNLTLENAGTGAFHTTFKGNVYVADGSASAPSYTFDSDTDTGFYSAASNRINIAAGGSDRGYFSQYGLNMTVNASGYVSLNRSGFITFYGNDNANHGIGSRDNVGTATDDLRINSYAAVYINLDSNSNNTTNADFVIGRHGGGTSTMDLLLSVSGEDGDLITEGNVTAYGSPSDIRLKENVERIADPINKVKQLDGITFDYKKDGSRSTGLIAQQLLEVLPEVVYDTEDLHTGEKHLAVRYGNVVGLLVEALKEQQTQIDNLTMLVNQLKEK